VSGPRRLSQAISEGDGISLIAVVPDAAAAEAAEEAGAEGVALQRHTPGVREATSLPVLALSADARDADAALLVVEDEGDDLEARQLELHARGLEVVVDVRTDEELEFALERIEPEIFLISPRAADDDDSPLERVLALLPDVPAGKLAIAEVPAADREMVAALERAGFDAVLVAAADVAGLAQAEPPVV
jgi:indole-3-glycerol phosphate synthase